MHETDIFTSLGHWELISRWLESGGKWKPLSKHWLLFFLWTCSWRWRQPGMVPWEVSGCGCSPSPAWQLWQLLHPMDLWHGFPGLLSPWNHWVPAGILPGHRGRRVRESKRERMAPLSTPPSLQALPKLINHPQVYFLCSIYGIYMYFLCSIFHSLLEAR